MSARNTLRVAVTGGIGSGKSVVCNVLRALGHEVFDTDAEARRIMDTDRSIHRRLVAGIHPLAVVGGRVDRRRISDVVFADPAKLELLNSIVHESVRRELEAWFKARCDAGVLFVETAILYQSGLDAMVGRVWEVTAPEDIRVARVMTRSKLDEAAVRARIEAQRFAPARPHPAVTRLTNDGHLPLLPQIEKALAAL